MNLRSFGIAVLLALPAAAQTSPTPAPAGAAAPAPAAAAASKIAVIQFQEAVLSTQEGQQASATLKAKYDPRKTALERRQAELQALQDKLQKGTMPQDAQAKAQADLANGSKVFKRDADDLNADVQEEEGKIMQAMATKMGDVIQKYATANGFSVVMDVSSQQTPVLWASQASNITADIVKQYDTAYPVKKAAAAAQAPAPAPKAPASK